MPRRGLLCAPAGPFAPNGASSPKYPETIDAPDDSSPPIQFTTVGLRLSLRAVHLLKPSRSLRDPNERSTTNFAICSGRGRAFSDSQVMDRGALIRSPQQKTLTPLLHHEYHFRFRCHSGCGQHRRHRRDVLMIPQLSYRGTGLDHSARIRCGCKSVAIRAPLGQHLPRSLFRRARPLRLRR